MSTFFFAFFKIFFAHSEVEKSGLEGMEIGGADHRCFRQEGGCRIYTARYLMERITNDRKNRCENRQPII